MLKKLDKLILKAFAGPFIATFFIAVFVLMMQILWKYVDDLVGKGLDLITIAQFMWYASASLLVLAMPIAILISSIMTLGNIGETFELVAIKSAGISLLRLFRPLIVVIAFCAALTFLFANYIIPVTNLKFITLYNDIFYKKPAFDLKEGVFYTQIPSYAIKIGKKGKDGQTINDILIYDQTNPLQDNTIIAKSGRMSISPDQNFLEFYLRDGHRYQENGLAGDGNTEFTTLQFESFKKLFDLSVLKKGVTSDSVFQNSQKMLSARQLQENIDTLRKLQITVNQQRRKSINNILPFLNDTSAGKNKTNTTLNIPDSLENKIHARAYGIASDLRATYTYAADEKKLRDDDIKINKLEWHRKFSLSFACFILFFIGAPLGSIIRKGGFGMPLVAGISFFLIFHLLNMFGEKFVRENILSPVLGMWLAVIGLFPLCIFLTYKAMHDSQLFNKEFYYRTFNRIKTLLIPKK